MIYVIIWAHWIADFVLQTDRMAKGKSSSNAILFQHVASYSAFLFMVLFWSPPLSGAIKYCITNGVAHFAVDFVTSRMTKKLWAEKRVHDFFVVIGLDQAIHMTTLIVTLPLLGGNL